MSSLERLDAWLKQIEKENNMTAYSIRTARIETDLPDIVRITNPYESQPITVDQMREWFQYNPPGRVQRRMVSVDENDAVTGYGGYVHEADGPDHHFTVWVIVASDCRGQGIGSALWDNLLEDLQEQGATRLVRMCSITIRRAWPLPSTAVSPSTSIFSTTSLT